MNRRLKIIFVLPCLGNVPAGGPKIVYEYANCLARMGHLVSVVHPSRSCNRTIDFWGWVKNWTRYFQICLGKEYRPDQWFHIDPNVTLSCTPSLSEGWIPNGDVVIATAWQTAEWVCRYSMTKGSKYYLIQGLELWGGYEQRVYATWKMPLRKIVIANWLRDIALEMGETAEYIPNGLNSNEFQMDILPRDRSPYSILMLYSEGWWKASADGIEALSLVKSIVPNMCAVFFGVLPRPTTLPSWIVYFQRPEQTVLRKLYNNAAIFVSPSRTEGWGLPPSEAMLCGAALVATDIGGHREYAIHNRTALLSPANAPKALAENVLRLLLDSKLRIRIATQGYSHIQHFTWERASNSLEAVFYNFDKSLSNKPFNRSLAKIRMKERIDETDK